MPSASAVSGTPAEPGEEAAHKSQSIFCYSGSYSDKRQKCHRARNLLVLGSPQFSFTLGQRSSCGHKSVLAICVFLPYKQSVSNSSACENRLSTRLGPAIAGSARLACLSQAVTLCAVRYVLYTSHKNAKNLGVLQHPQSTHLSTALHSRRIPLNVPRIEEYHVHAQHHFLYTGHTFNCF